VGKDTVLAEERGGSSYGGGREGNRVRRKGFKANAFRDSDKAYWLKLKKSFITNWSQKKGKTTRGGELDAIATF